MLVKILEQYMELTIYGIDQRLEGDCFYLGKRFFFFFFFFKYCWPLEEIRLQILLLRMPSMDISESDEFIPFADLKCYINKYVLELWQCPKNKCINCFQT